MRLASVPYFSVFLLSLPSPLWAAQPVPVSEQLRTWDLHLPVHLSCLQDIGLFLHLCLDPSLNSLKQSCQEAVIVLGVWICSVFWDLWHSHFFCPCECNILFFNKKFLSSTWLLLVSFSMHMEFPSWFIHLWSVFMYEETSPEWIIWKCF